MASSAREMIDRQPLDDGDADDDVFRPQKHGVAGHDGQHHSRVYHDDETCFQLQKVDRPTETISREVAQQQWLGPCNDCVLNGSDSS